MAHGLTADGGEPPQFEPRRIWRRPETDPGRWSSWLLLGFVVLLAVFFGSVASGQRGGDTFFANLWLSLPIVAAGASGVIAGLLAGFAILRRGERSGLAFLACLVGALIAAWVGLEVAFPH